jgi:pimeloyl-ACP methyl ester carboxylesterase
VSAQARVLKLRFSSDAETPRSLRLQVWNARRDTELHVADSVSLCDPLPDRACGCSFELNLETETTVTLTPPAADVEDPFVFAVLGDVQRAIGSVHEVYERMNQDPELSFVASSGDLVNTGERAELERFQDELSSLQIPYFSTVGNHELGGSPQAWHQLFGRFNVHFQYKGVTFSLLDAGNASIDPIVYGWLADWLDQAHDGTHAVFMHIPPLDPVGLRGGGFRSRKEGAKLMQLLGDGRVDTLSLGGMVASWLAVDASERVDRLILASTLPSGGEVSGDALGRGVAVARCMLKPAREAEACMALRILSHELRAQHPDQCARIRAEALAQPASHIGLVQLMLAAARHDVRTQLPNISAPTLLLAGERDPILTLSTQQELLHGIPDARLESIPKAGHDISVEAPEATAERVIAHVHQTRW